MEKQRLLIGSVLMAVVGLPFALRLIPPNDSFGLHTHWLLTNRVAWIRANSFMGWTFVAFSFAGIALSRVRPDLAESAGTLIIVALAIGAIAVCFGYLSLFA